MNSYIKNLISWDDEKLNEEAYKIREDESEIFDKLSDFNNIVFYISAKRTDLLRLILALDKIISKLKEYFYERVKCLDRDGGYEEITGLAPEDYLDYDEESDESFSLARDAYDKVDNLEYNINELIKIRNIINRNVETYFN